jgi:hypothetical protein
MRACAHCGLSIGDAATYCAVCGARCDSVTSTTPAPAREAPAPQPAADASVRASVQDERHSRSVKAEPPKGLRTASISLRDAGRLEKTEPARAAALYREAALGLLAVSADPLESADVRRDLLRVFDRLSLVLKREGLPVDALEEIDSAASLGLLDCRDRGVKGHREALTKRRESLRRDLDGHPSTPARASRTG